MTTKANPDNETTFACDMSVMTPDERQQHLATIQELFGAVQEIRELADGYSFRLESNDYMLLQAAEFIMKEQLCCPFFRFNIDAKPNGDIFWLSLTGPEGVKPFIKAEIGESLADEIAREANFRHSEDG